MLLYCDADLTWDDHPGGDAADPNTPGHTRLTPSTSHVLQFAHLLPPANWAGGLQEPLVAANAAIIGVNIGRQEVWGCEVHVKVSQLASLHFLAEMQDGSFNDSSLHYSNFSIINLFYSL